MPPDLLPAISAMSEARRSATSADHKSTWGQYFTPSEIATFMASRVRVPTSGHLTLLDPGAGTGLLGVAAARQALAAGAASVRLIAVEAEPTTRELLQRSLALAQAQLGPALQATVRGEDFLDLHQPQVGVEPLPTVDLVIANPPYFKMSPSEVRGGDAPNAYARFMQVSADLLRPGGQLLFIVPRSFASGFYFQRFRQRFHRDMVLEWAHLFGSRREAFRDEEVLQESLIVAYRKGGPQPGTVEISSSAGLGELARPRRFAAPRALVLRPDDPAGVLHLPTGPEDAATLRAVQAWPARLASLGLEISTGPVVPFRTEHLAHAAADGTVPLLWMQHVRQGEVRWPLGAGFRKPEHIQRTAGPRLLVPNQTCVLLRRFSAKEERRRLTVAVLERGQLPGALLGLENHLNYIHRPGGTLDPRAAWGLGALLASTRVDDTFRIQSGNTQVSATELRALPLPSQADLDRLGDAVLARGGQILQQQEALDALVQEVLRHG